MYIHTHICRSPENLDWIWEHDGESHNMESIQRKLLDKPPVAEASRGRGGPTRPHPSTSLPENCRSARGHIA